MTDGDTPRIGVAVADFNEVITAGLLAGALEALEAAGISDVPVVRVPGAWELPLAVRKLIDAGVDAVVAVGAVIEGETDHYAHIATETSHGLQRVALDTGVPVSNAVLTVREFAHARDRSVPGKSNKGYEAARAAIAMIEALRGLPGR